MAHTAKTKKILGLLEQQESAPALNPAIKDPERESVPIVFIKSEVGTQFVNVPFLLINEQLGSIMERFNCCTCDKCVTDATVESLANMPPTVIRIKRSSEEESVNKAAADMRAEAIHVITKAVMYVKANPRH